jgi:HSP20 family protein
MTTVAIHDTPPPENDLTSWVDAPASEHDPKVEDYLDGDRCVIRADLPGIDPDRDLQLTLEDGVLRVCGERRAEPHRRRRAEIRYGRFERTVTLPPGVRPEAITAEYVDGVLTISLPAVVTSVPQPIRVVRPECAPDQEGHG